MSSTSIKNWHESERPVEKFIDKGADALTNAELLAIILKTGTAKASALDIAKAILEDCQHDLRSLTRLNKQKLTDYKGIGDMKAVVILATLELGKRISRAKFQDRPVIKGAEDVYELLAPHLTGLEYEEFWVVYLNRANKVLAEERLSQGTTKASLVDVKMLLKRACELLAESIVVCHNHPSGTLKASEADIAITKKIKQASQFFDIQLLDHVIIAHDRFLSLHSEGLL